MTRRIEFDVRSTVNLSSSDNSSIPKIAMISCNSLYFEVLIGHLVPLHNALDQQFFGSNALDVDAKGSTAGRYPSQLIYVLS